MKLDAMRYEVITHANREYILINKVITKHIPGLCYYYVWGIFTPDRLLYSPVTNIFGGFDATETIISKYPIDYMSEEYDQDGEVYLKMPAELTNIVDRFRCADHGWDGGEYYSPDLDLMLNMWKSQ